MREIVLICQNGMQLSVVVENVSAIKVASQIVKDLDDPNKKSIRVSDYAPTKDETQELWIKSELVQLVMIKDRSSIAVPNKKLVIPDRISKPTLKRN